MQAQRYINTIILLYTISMDIILLLLAVSRKIQPFPQLPKLHVLNPVKTQILQHHSILDNFLSSLNTQPMPTIPPSRFQSPPLSCCNHSRDPVTSCGPECNRKAVVIRYGRDFTYIFPVGASSMSSKLKTPGYLPFNNIGNRRPILKL